MLPTALGLIWTPHLEHAFVRAIEAEEKEEEEEDDDDEEEDDDDDFFCFLLGRSTLTATWRVKSIRASIALRGAEEEEAVEKLTHSKFTAGGV